MAVNPREIWLEPFCDSCARNGGERTWCEDCVYDDCDVCGAKPVLYVLGPGETCNPTTKESA